MVDVGKAIGYLDLDTTGFKKGFKSALGDLKILTDKSAKISDKFSAVGSSMTSVGSSLTKGVTIPLVAAGAGALKFATGFEKSLSGVKAITEATSNEMALMKKSALELGASTSFSAGEVAAGMTELGSAGFSVNEILQAMPGLLDIAASSGTDLATATEITASALRGFGMEASESGHVADIFAKAAADTNANVVDMGESMKYVAPVAAAMGISIEEASAAIGILANSGIKGGQAGTVLRASLSRLAKPAKEASDAMKEMNFSAYDGQGNMKSLDEIVNGLRSSMSGMTEQQKQNTISTIFGQEAMSGMLVLLNSEEGALKNLTTELENSEGAAKKMADTMLDNTSGSIEELMGSLETLAISIGDLLIPMFRDIVEWLTKVVNSFNNLDEGTKKIIVEVLKVVAIAGPILLVVGKLVSGIGSFISLISTVSTALGALGVTIGAIAWPVLAVVAAIAALWVAWQNDFGGIREYTTEIFNSIKELIDIFWTWLTDIWESNLLGIQDWWNFIWNTIETVFEQVFDSIKTFFDFWVKIFQGDFQGAWDVLKEFWGRMWDRIKSIFTEWWTTFSTTFMQVWNNICDFFKGIWDEIAKFFSDTWNNIIAFFAETIPAWIDSVIEWFKELPHNLGIFVGEMIGHVLNFGKSIWEWLTVELPKFIQGVIDWFAKLPGEIWKWLTDIVNKIINWGFDIKAKGEKAVVNMWNAIIDWFKKLPSEIQKWFDEVLKFLGSLPAKMFDIGKNIINGLWDGLKNVWDSVLGWFNDVFAKIGEFFTGVGEGMDKTQDKANRVSSSTDGSYRDGLDYVPRDGFKATLHEGEQVLTKEQARDNRASKGDTYNFYSPKALTPVESAREMKKAKRDLELGFN